MGVEIEAREFWIWGKTNKTKPKRNGTDDVA